MTLIQLGNKQPKQLEKLTDLDTGSSCNWCPGCGDFGILVALKQAIFELKLDPENVMVVSGIGCGSQAPHLIKTYGYHSIHGRALAVASGMRVANDKMTLIVIGGDGDGYGIGMSHFIHNARRNYNLLYIVQNNQIYGLTKGQTSPTSEHLFKTKSTPEGVIEPPIRPLTLGMAAGATFVARGYAGDVMHLKELIKAGIQHKGFAHIDTLQPCVTFNQLNTYQWYQERIYKLGDDYDPRDRSKALLKTEEWGEKIPIGIYYQEDRWTYEESLPMLEEQTLVEQDISNVDINPLLQAYT